MDQEKIGKFIAKVRKEKKMTQQELADKLRVTDRAIGNWENGRRMPDVVFFKPLCEILDISLNELLSGERINKEELKEKTDEVLTNSINYSNGIIKKLKKIIIILLLSIWAFFLTINLIRVNNREKPIMCIGTKLMKDGGSGHYMCLGYSFDIEGNFNPEAINYGVNKYDFYFLGIKLKSKSY